jgi:hypothetical protein
MITKMEAFVKGLRTRMRARYRKDQICGISGPCMYGTSEAPPELGYAFRSCRHAAPHSIVDCQSCGCLSALPFDRHPEQCIKIGARHEVKKGT